ncbi:hypothetical protein NW752_010818 [Fusarium irregulare]|uniref:Uncharacterized protein n=1 Tax=Fusarium irregulare TaxID=2494466 RepID=A0A9W8U541_9HYPO|nr:hypothetical protein NW766_011961 [Fusarium irregulare]KAJ4006171.1 hypothetical protein NW752_010818 [Fusarium irregulare]
MSPTRPSPRGNDTGDQYDSKRELNDLMNSDPETLQDFFRDLSPIPGIEEILSEIETSQETWSSQVAGDQILGSSQPTDSPPDPTPESSYSVPCSQGVPLVLLDVHIPYAQTPSGSAPQENSNECNALNCEAAETSPLGAATGGFGGGDGILENGNPFDFCAPPQPEREIGRYYHYHPQDRSFVNYSQETFPSPCPRESQPAASAASSNDDSSKPPPSDSKNKPSASKKCSKPANRPRQKTITSREHRRSFRNIAPQPRVQNTQTTANRPLRPPPSSTQPLVVLGTLKPLNGNGYSYGYDRHVLSGPLVQVGYGTMNGNIPRNMGYSSMPPNASFGNSNGNSMHPGITPQGQLHSVQNNSNGQSINNVGIYRPPTSINGNANGLHGGFHNSPINSAPRYPANTSRQHDMASGADFVPSPLDSDRCRRRAREAGTDYFEGYERSSMGSNAAGSYHTSSPSSSPWEHTDEWNLPIRQPSGPPGEVRGAPRVYTSTDSPMGYTTGGFSQSSTSGSSAMGISPIGSYPIGSSPMGSMGGTSYMTATNGIPMPHIGSSPSDLASMPRREVNGGRRGNSSTFLNNPPGANNTDQNNHSYHPYPPREYRQARRVYTNGKQQEHS